jgi:hypothetical protein
MALSQFFKRFGPVTQIILGLFAEFTECLIVSLGKKQRIITKPTLPARFKAQPSFTTSLEQFGLELKIVG